MAPFAINILCDRIGIFRCDNPILVKDGLIRPVNDGIVIIVNPSCMIIKSIVVQLIRS